ncbi:hypothetical protein ACFLTR_01255, partial [Chloroflexota bacterium]
LCQSVRLKKCPISLIANTPRWETNYLMLKNLGKIIFRNYNHPIGHGTLLLFCVFIVYPLFD